MKTYYDLKKEEKKDYEKEFKKTPGGKSMNEHLIIAGIVSSLFFILDLIVVVMLPSDTYNYDAICGVTNILFWVSFLVEIAYNTYFQICFCSWLKNKHDIKRW